MLRTTNDIVDLPSGPVLQIRPKGTEEPINVAVDAVMVPYLRRYTWHWDQTQQQAFAQVKDRDDMRLYGLTYPRLNLSRYVAHMTKGDAELEISRVIADDKHDMRKSAIIVSYLPRKVDPRIVKAKEALAFAEDLKLRLNARKDEVPVNLMTAADEFVKSAQIVYDAMADA